MTERSSLPLVTEVGTLGAVMAVRPSIVAGSEGSSEYSLRVATVSV